MVTLKIRAAQDPLSSGKSLVRKRRKNFAPAHRMLFAIVVCAILFAQALPARSGSTLAPQSYGYFDFPTCVRYALVHSEDFLKNRLDIQIRSADLKDAHSEILPTIEIITRYYLARAGGNQGGSVGDQGRKRSPFSIQFQSTSWDPYMALVKIKSQGILVDIGKISHIDKISDNMATMAKTFYRIHILEKTLRARRQMVALHQNKVSFGKSRQEQSAVDPLEVRLWTNNLRGEQIKAKNLEKELEDRIGELKMLMGYPPDYYLPLDTRDAANQILGGFNGQLVTFAEIQGSNFGLQIMAKKEQLQSNYVTGAYVALIPKPLLVVEDVQNQVDRTSGFNLAVGFDTTLWDGFRRVRDIKRQKMRAQALAIDRRRFSEKLYNNFKHLRGELDLSGEREAFYREQARLAELTEEKALLEYKAGNVTYDQYVEKRLERLEAHLGALGSVQDRVQALIDLATIAGGLNKYNARIQF